MSVPTRPREAILADEIFFRQHTDRRLHIREPIAGEYEAEFQSLGMHLVGRRRVIVLKLPRAIRRQTGVEFMPIPFLLRADETVEDRDDILGPIYDELMRAEARKIGMA